MSAAVREFGIGTLDFEPAAQALLSVVELICAAVYGGVYALAHFVQPHPRDMSVWVRPDQLFKDSSGLADGSCNGWRQSPHTRSRRAARR